MISSALKSFHELGKVDDVIFAEKGRTAPQPLAYRVHFPRLSVTLSGVETMWLEQSGRNALVHLSGGKAVVVPANSWNRLLWSSPSLTLNVLFGRHQIGVSLVQSDGLSPIPISVEKTSLQGAVAEAPRNMMEALLALRPGAMHAAVPLVDALLRCVSESLGLPAPSTPKRRATSLYQSICMHVQEHFQFPLNRDSVAESFNVSPNHVSRLFKQEGMVSFNDYVSFVRINRAKYLLTHHRQTIDEVASACGFSEASYFCRVFKKFTNATPTHYRQQQDCAAVHGKQCGPTHAPPQVEGWQPAPSSADPLPAVHAG
jgi:AraC-like DNA-binding protein